MMDLSEIIEIYISGSYLTSLDQKLMISFLKAKNRLIIIIKLYKIQL